MSDYLDFVHENLPFFIVGTFILCCFPISIAGIRQHKNFSAIVALTLLLGWTFIGWAIAMVWAFTDNVEPKKTDDYIAQEREYWDASTQYYMPKSKKEWNPSTGQIRTRAMRAGAPMEIDNTQNGKDMIDAWTNEWKATRAIHTQ